MAYIKENKNKLMALYNRMGDCLAAELPKDWTHACLGFFVDKHGRESMLIYATKDGGSNWIDLMETAFESDEIMFGVFDCKECCQELYQLCAKVGDKWSRFTLTMDASGRFNADFNYDAFEKLTPILKRMWMGEYLE